MSYILEQDYQNGTNTLYDFIDGLAQLHAGEMIKCFQIGASLNMVIGYDSATSAAMD